MKSIEQVFAEIAAMQDPEWDGRCLCTECYWNMWSPSKRPDNSQCASESLSDTKMIPNTEECPSYRSFQVACGCPKE